MFLLLQDWMFACKNMITSRQRQTDRQTDLIFFFMHIYIPSFVNKCTYIFFINFQQISSQFFMLNKAATFSSKLLPPEVLVQLLV